MKRIEALALVIAKYSGGFDPEDQAFRLCNPGRLKVYSARLLPGMADGGLRTFGSWLDGLRGLVFDLTVKCGGRSRTHIRADARLRDLLGMWGMKLPRKAITFLRRALEDAAIDARTPIGWFVEDQAICDV